MRREFFFKLVACVALLVWATCVTVRRVRALNAVRRRLEEKTLSVECPVCFSELEVRAKDETGVCVECGTRVEGFGADGEPLVAESERAFSITAAE